MLNSRGGGRGTRLRVTPLARRIALAHGVELGAVAGTGPGGRVLAADVRACVQGSRSPQGVARSADAGAHEGHPQGAPEHTISQSPLVPVATATVEFDAGVALAAAEGAGRPWLRVGLAALVTAAAGALLPAFGELNGAWGGEALVLRRRVHIAVGEAGAAEARWGVVRDAGDLTARGVARALAVGDRGEATFLVLSLAEGAGWQSAAPPLPGTAAALSVGSPERRAVVRDEGLLVRPMATLTLSYDARVADHRRVAAFLGALRERLEGRLG